MLELFSLCDAGEFDVILEKKMQFYFVSKIPY